MATYFVKSGDDYKEVSIDDLRKSEKLIPESDLLALKGSNDSTIKKLEKDLDTINSEKETLLNRATAAESAVETVKTELEPLKSEAAKAATLQVQLDELKTKSSAAETQLLERSRKDFVKKFNLSGDKAKQVDTMTLDEIQSHEKALELVGVGAGNSNGNTSDGFARTNNSNSTEPPKTSFNAIKDALSNGQLPVRGQDNDSKE